jgi:hypothetical protein
MRTLALVGLFVITACGNNGGRRDACTTERDRLTPILEENAAQLLSTIGANLRSEAEARSKAEMEAFKKSFVDVCVKHAKFPLKCYERTQATRELRECQDHDTRAERKAMDGEIYESINH